MGCGCNRNSSIPYKGAKKMDAMQGQSGSNGNYEDTLACAKCYAKHLSKAEVEYAEYSEDQTRIAELSLCIGDIACAEDHAQALRRTQDKEALRRIRDRIVSSARQDPNVVAELRNLAVQAMRSVVDKVKADARMAEERAKKAAEEAKAKAQDAQKVATDEKKSYTGNSPEKEVSKDASEK